MTESIAPGLAAKRSCQNLYDRTVAFGAFGWSASGANPCPKANGVPSVAKAPAETVKPFTISLPSVVRSVVRQDATPIATMDRARVRSATSAAGEASVHVGQVALRCMIH